MVSNRVLLISLGPKKDCAREDKKKDQIEFYKYKIWSDCFKNHSFGDYLKKKFQYEVLGFIDHNIVQYVKLLIYYIVKLDTYILLGIILFYIPYVVVEGGFHFSIDFTESMTNQCMDRNPVSRDLFIAVTLFSDEISSSLSLNSFRCKPFTVITEENG